MVKQEYFNSIFLSAFLALGKNEFKFGAVS